MAQGLAGRLGMRGVECLVTTVDDPETPVSMYANGQLPVNSSNWTQGCKNDLI